MASFPSPRVPHEEPLLNAKSTMVELFTHASELNIANNNSGDGYYACITTMCGMKDVEVGRLVD
jgi:hypothetical protein